ncbi:hypothetical protein KIPB_006644, partial [Kipferlia bialata]|eukprot:g6644.t1
MTSISIACHTGVYSATGREAVPLERLTERCLKEAQAHLRERFGQCDVDSSISPSLTRTKRDAVADLDCVVHTVLGI